MSKLNWSAVGAAALAVIATATAPVNADVSVAAGLAAITFAVLATRD